MIRLRPAFILAALCLTLACAAANPAPPAVLPEGVTVDFPDSISFTMPDPPADVDEAGVVYQVGRRSCSNVTGYGYAVTNGRALRWTWDIAEAGGLPPGAGITYHWEVRDASGAVHSTPEQSFVVEDARYTWRAVTDGPITVRWHAGSESFARQLLQSANRSLETLARETGTPLQGEATIHVYQNTDEMRGALINAQEWTGGAAFPDYGMIVLAVPPTAAGVGQLYIAHELSHLFVGQATFNCYVRAPSWLDEGLATRAEGAVRPEFQASLDNAIARGDLFSVRALRAAFPTDPREATLAYAQSRSFVEYLLEEQGARKMADLLEGFREGLTDDAALLHAYGFDQAGLYARWRAWEGLAASESTAPLPTSTQPAPRPSVTSAASTLTASENPATPAPVGTVGDAGRPGGCLPAVVGSHGTLPIDIPLAMAAGLGLAGWGRRRG